MNMTVTSDLPDLTDLVRESLRDPAAEIAEQRVEPVLPAPTMMATAGLHRVRGTTVTGAEWSFVVKSVHSVRHWPGLVMVPEHLRAQFVERFPWRTDIDAYLAGEPLPPGLRMPRLHRLDDLGDDRLVAWMEDVRTVPEPWDLARYARAAALLGEVAASRPSEYNGNAGLRVIGEGPLPHLWLPALRDDATWAHPLVAPFADDRLRADILALAARYDALLADLARLPHTRVHGDAAPQNLLVPADGSAEFVAIDWSWGDPAPIGFDLGQLIVGLANDGQIDPADLPAIHETILDAYGGDRDQVRVGYTRSMVLRSLWPALPLERLADEPTDELGELFRRRIGLARFIADLVLVDR